MTVNILTADQLDALATEASRKTFELIRKNYDLVPKSRWLTLDQAAKDYEVCKRTVQRRYAKGIIQGQEFGGTMFYARKE